MKWPSNYKAGLWALLEGNKIICKNKTYSFSVSVNYFLKRIRWDNIWMLQSALFFWEGYRHNQRNLFFPFLCKTEFSTLFRVLLSTQEYKCNYCCIKYISKSITVICLKEIMIHIMYNPKFNGFCGIFQTLHKSSPASSAVRQQNHSTIQQGVCQPAPQQDLIMSNKHRDKQIPQWQMQSG